MAHAARHVRHVTRHASIRSVTAVVVALVIGGMIGPVAVHAADSLVTIVGPGAAQQSQGVKVTAGHLRVGDAKGPLTVDGAVLARPTLPKTPVFLRTFLNGNTETTLFKPTKGSTRLGMTSITITNQGSSRDTFDMGLRPSCNPQESVTPLYQLLIPPLTTVHMPLPTPFVVGHLPNVWCVVAASGGQFMTITVVGFTA